MLRLKKNDRVKVVSGNHKGKEGKILKIFPDKNAVIVEGVNIKDIQKDWYPWLTISVLRGAVDEAIRRVDNTTTASHA